MATNQKKNAKNGEVNIVDVFFYLLVRWKWFLLSVLIFIALAWLKYERAPRVYQRAATVFIKDPETKNYSASLDRYDTYINRVNVTTEIYKFRSKRLLSEVVSRTNADVSYKIEEGLHDKELYSQSPVIVTFIDFPQSSSVSFKVQPRTETKVKISGLEEGKSLEVSMKDTVNVGNFKIVVTPTDYYTKSAYGTEINVTKVPVMAMVGYYLNNIGVEQEEDETSIIRLTLKDSSPLRAENVLSTLITVYNEDSIRDKNQIAINTEDFINERLIVIENELGGVETDLETFKKANQVPIDVESTAGVYSSESQKYNADVLDLDNQIQLVKYMKAYLTDPSKETELIPTNTGIGNAAIESQIAQYNALRLKRNNLIEDGGETNPVVQEMTTYLLQLKQNIVRTVDNYLTEIQAKRKDFRSRESRANARIASIPTKAREMLSIERQQKIKEQLYLFLLNRREENALTKAMVDNNAQIIDEPDGSNSPVSPSRNKILLLGFLVGLAIPGVYFLMQMFLDTKVRSRHDIKEAVDVPFLGEVPLDKEAEKASKKGQPRIPVKDNPDGIVAEAFSMIRTNLHFMSNEGKPVKAITLTSFAESAGKTFVISNLAMSLIRAGKSIILVDLDIRKGSLSHLFKCGKVGVTNYLADNDNDIKIVDLIQKDGLYNELDIIPAGAVAPNPAELLMSSKLDDLIAELKSRYDYVLIDNVPVGIVADAKITNRLADLTIFVAKSGVLDKRQLQDLQDLYTNKELHNLTMVFNGTTAASLGYNSYGHYGYGYGYGGYGYGYGYGFGHKYGNGYYGKKKTSKRLSKKDQK